VLGDRAGAQALCASRQRRDPTAEFRQVRSSTRNHRASE